MSQQHSTHKMASGLPWLRWFSKDIVLPILSLMIDAALICIILVVFFINKFPYKNDDGIVKYYLQSIPNDIERKTIGDMIIDEALSHRDYESFKKKLLSNNPGIDNEILHPRNYLISVSDMISHGYKQLVDNGRQYYITITMINLLSNCFRNNIDRSTMPKTCHSNLHNKYERNEHLNDDKINEYKEIKYWLDNANSDASENNNVIELLKYNNYLQISLTQISDQISDNNVIAKLKIKEMIEKINEILKKSYDESALYIEVPEPFLFVLIYVLIFVIFKIVIMRSLHITVISAAIPTVSN